MLVCYPYSIVDQHLAVNLAGWIEELGKYKGHTCLIVKDVRCEESVNEQIRKALGNTFDSVESIDSTEQTDGWPRAANWMFQKAARHVEYNQKCPWLWIEADCVPMRSGWLDPWPIEYQKSGKPFMGQRVQVANVPIHMSGCGIYPGIMTKYAGLALLADDTAWDVYSSAQIVPQMHDTKLIAHRWRHPAIENQEELEKILENIGEATIFHADKSGSMIKLLRERRKPAVVEQPAQTNPVAVKLETGRGIVADIFIKTYPKDYPWLEWCLRSIDKFCSGFRKIDIVSPTEPITRFERSGDSHNLKTDYSVHKVSDKENDGYLEQQRHKMYADTFTDADHILHMDSDCIFARPVTPETFFTNGKINWLCTPYDKVDAPWKPITEKFLKRPVKFEFMRRHPTVIPRWLYGELRAFCEKQHGMTLDKYIMSQPHRSFSEFNAIGAFAYYFHHDKFNWIDTEKVPEKDWPELVVDQRFSHDPIPTEEWEKVLDNNKTIERFCIPDPDIQGITLTDNHPIRYEKRGDKFVQVEVSPVSSREKNERSQEKKENLADGYGKKETSGGFAALRGQSDSLPNPVSHPNRELTMPEHVSALKAYASENGFARMRVIRQLKRAGLLPKGKKK